MSLLICKRGQDGSSGPQLLVELLTGSESTDLSWKSGRSGAGQGQISAFSVTSLGPQSSFLTSVRLSR